MVKPDCVLVQEIKVVPVKTKIMDMVAIRHPSSSSDHRTTLILLCEDGSLRIYNASMEHSSMRYFLYFRIEFVNYVLFLFIFCYSCAFVDFCFSNSSVLVYFKNFIFSMRLLFYVTSTSIVFIIIVNVEHWVFTI